jgi:release factor glutamine methyltransferase
LRITGVRARLVAAGCVAADEEADELVAAAPDAATLERWVRRREQGEPLAWITGTTRFCGQTVHVDAGVYVPRPQTEELARRAAAALAVSPGRAADLCTGSGAIAVHLMRAVPAAAVVAVDIDERAARCARRNGVDTVCADIALPVRERSCDVVTAVAPYVPTPSLPFLPSDIRRFEPRRALDGGADGLDVTRRVVVAAERILRRRGWLFVEVGGDQHLGLASTLTSAGFGPGDPWADADGNLRGVAAQLVGG